MNNSKDKDKNKSLGLLAITASAVALTSFALSKYMVGYAINRKQPCALTKSRGSHNKPTLKRKFYAEMAVKSKELAQIPHRVIKIVSHNGTILTGHYFVKEGAKRTILAMHGWRSNWNRDFSFVGKFLLEQDNNVLFIEQRGQNNSEGDYISLGIIERYDCLDWVRWINDHTNNDMPIYLYGISMGATSVLMATGLYLPSNVKGVIADCGYTSPDKIGNYVVHHKLHMIYGLKKMWSKGIFEHRLHFKMNAYSTLDAMKQCKIPVLFIHGEDDNFVPVKMTYQNFEKCIAPKQLLIVPKAGHAMSYFIEPDEYEKYLIDFWNKYDK